MDSFNADIVLNVIRYLSAKDSLRLASASSRYYYLVCQYRRLRGPELVASASRGDPLIKTRQKSSEEVVDDALSRIQAPPTFALAFGKTVEEERLSRTLPRMLPDETIVLEAVSDSIQSCLNGHLESKSRSSVMLGTLDRECGTAMPFCLNHMRIRSGNYVNYSDEENYQAMVQSLLEASSKNDWRVFLVYVCGGAALVVDKFIALLQEAYPDAAIVGGICSGGSVSVPSETLLEGFEDLTSLKLIDAYYALGGRPEIKQNQSYTKEQLQEAVRELIRTKRYCLEHLEDGIFGIAFAGDVPVRSVVSRGVKSLVHRGQPQPSTPLFIDQVDLMRPGDEGYMGDGILSYHLVRRIKDADTGRFYNPLQLLASYGQPDMFGLRRPSEDGFEVHTPHPISYSIGSFVFLIEGNFLAYPLEGVNVDLYDLDGASCMNDMERKMQLLKRQTEGERILGAVMYSCAARGPMAGSLITEDMADAKRFAEAFADDNVPCLGFYAGGEIGPLALAGCQKESSVFQTGNARLQSFTAVFAVFVVPAIDLSKIRIDDGADNVRAFVHKKLHRRTAA